MIPENRIAVWGIGYLGYSMILKLQQAGVSVNAWAIGDDNLHLFKEGKYPDGDTLNAWCESKVIPTIDSERIHFAESAEQMFQAQTDTHIVALPNIKLEDAECSDLWDKLARIFSEHLPQDRDTYVILAAAPIPGRTETFEKQVCETRPRCHVLTAFRSDWKIEDFLYRKTPHPLGGPKELLENEVFSFFERLNLPVFHVGSNYDAEVFHVFSHSFQYMTSAFASQFSQAYPETDIRRLLKNFKRYGPRGPLKASLGIGGKQVVVELEQTMMGAKYNCFLSMLHEAQRFNLSTLISCADYLSRHNYREVKILGIAPNPNNSDISMSTSLILAEALLKKGVEVKVHDPLFNTGAIKEIIPDIQELDLDEIGLDTEQKNALILVTAHQRYREFNQNMIDDLINDKADLIIDNTEIWKHFRYSGRTQYHVIGDGTIDLLS